MDCFLPSLSEYHQHPLERRDKVTGFSAEENQSRGCVFATSFVNMGRPFYVARQQDLVPGQMVVFLLSFWLTFLFPFFTLRILSAHPAFLLFPTTPPSTALPA